MDTNIEQAQGLNFSSCDNCTKSCCDGGRFILAPLVLDDFESVFKNFLIAFAMIDEKLRVVMVISNREKPCIYYKDNRCSIYEERPPACVIYPFTPYYDDIFIDTDCDAVGYVGFELRQDKNELLDKVHPDFYHKRFKGFSTKLRKTEDFLDDLEECFEPLFDVEGITLMSYAGKKEDEFLKMHHASLDFANKWN